MTKQQLQEELKEKVKEGIKPSHLKRSKSLGDIPSESPLSLTPPKTITLLEQENAELLKELRETQQLLDKSNESRYEALKKPSDNARITELQKELKETVKDASEEITKLETENKQLRTKLNQVNNQISTLTSDLNSHQRAAEFRLNNPFKENQPNYSAFWEDYGLIILLLGTYCLSTWMLSKNTYQRNNYE